MIKKITIVIVLLVGLLLGSAYYYSNAKQQKISVELSSEISVADDNTLEDNNNSVPAIEEPETVDGGKLVEKSDDVRPVSPPSDPQPTEREEPEETTPSLKVTKRLVSWGYQNASSRKIDTIVIHSSYDALGDDPYSVSGVISEYQQYQVSAHYLIDRKGTIFQLVDDKNIAYHAGESQVPDGRTGVNSFSLGIELLTTKKDKYTSAQYTALNYLLAELKDKYSIKYVLGHKDIAPGRKDDPWNFEWSKIK